MKKIYWLNEAETIIDKIENNAKSFTRYGVSCSIGADGSEDKIREAHGRIEIDRPVFDSATHKLGAVEVVEGELSWPVLKFTAQEITDNAAAALQAEREFMVLEPEQFRKAVNAAGKRAEVEAALSTMTQDEQDWWHVALRYERLHPTTIKLVGDKLGYSDTQIDNFFRNAAT